MKIQQIRRGIDNFIADEIISKIPDKGFKKIAISTFIGLYINGIEQKLLNGDIDMLKTVGIVDDAGDYNIDILINELKKNIPDSGTLLDINFLGARIGDMTLHKTDIDRLHSYIINSGGY